MTSFYRFQKLALIYMQDMIATINQLEEMNKDQFIINVLEKFEISERFIERTLEKFESIGKIKIKGNMIYPGKYDD